jgi:hypothetical protein
MVEENERSRRVVRRRHIAMRENLYGRAVISGDLRTALAVLQDLDELLGLYPAKRHEHTGKGGEPIPFTFIEVAASDPGPNDPAADRAG